MAKQYPESRFMSVAEAAALLGVSTKMVYRHIETHIIPAVNIAPRAKRPTLRIPKLKFESILRQWEHDSPAKATRPDRTAGKPTPAPSTEN